MTRVRIPVRVGSSDVPTRPAEPKESDARPPRVDPTPPERAETEARATAYRSSEEEDWRDRALRLQADMENYRRRQRRAAQEEARAERERLLRDVLGVADNLDRTLAARRPTPDTIRQGVELTRDELLRLLNKHGVERFQAQGVPFDPAWHEAVHVVPAAALGVEAGTVVEVVAAGYRQGERLLRPARVVVAN